MNKLNKIFYFNNDPFRYGEIDTSGNTLLTGTNGAGKSTAMRSVLFFYGVKNSSDLGLKKSDGKKLWRDYFYPTENSYTFFQYTGLHHEMLVMTYRHKNKLLYRFIKLNSQDTLSLKETVLESNKALMPKELLNLFTQKGYEVSEAITNAETYKAILYGQANSKTHPKFTQYALMKTQGDYNLIAKVLPEVFLNSSIRSRTIESAIANSYESDSDINLSQMHSQIIDTMKQYSSIVAFKDELPSRKKLEKELNQLTSQQERLFTSISNFMMSFNHYKSILPALHKKLELETQKNEQLCNDGQEHINKVNAERDKLLGSSKKLDGQLESAEKIADKFKDKDMPSIIEKVESLQEIEKLISNLQKQLDTITGEQGQITQKFSKLRENTRKESITRIEKRVQAEDDKRAKSEKLKSELRETLKQDTKSIKLQFKEKSVLLEKDVKQAEERYTSASNTKLLLNINQFNQKLLAEELALQKNSEEIQNSKHALELNKSTITATIKDRELISQKISQINNESNRIYEEYKKHINLQIQEQEKLLSPSEGSLLSFIRSQGEEGYDSVITSITKDSVLLQSDLEPSDSKLGQNDFFGITLKTENLKPSSYSLEYIKNTIASLVKKKEAKKESEEERIAPLLKELTRKENAKSQELLRLNEIGNRLESKLLSLESTNIKLQDSCVALSKSAKENFELAQQEVNAELAQSKKSLDLTKRLLNEHISALSDRLLEIEKNTDFQLQALEKDDLKRKEEYGLFRKEMELQLTKTLQEIDELENTALSDEGIDKQKVISLKNNIKEQENAHKKISKFKQIADEYSYNKEIISSIPQLQAKVKEAAKQYRDANNYAVSEKQKQEALETKQNKLVNALHTEIREAEFQINGVQEKIEQNGIELEKFDNNPLEFNLSEDLRDDIHNISNLQRLIEKSIEEISKIVQRVESKLGEHFMDPNNAIFKFHKGYGGDEIIAAAQDMISFAVDGRFDDAKILVARQIKMVYSIVSDNYLDLIKKSDNVSSLITKINKQLKTSIENIEIIRNIEMKYEPIIDPVLSALQEITSIDLPIGTQGSLFSTNNDSKTYTQILKAFEKLIDSLSKDKRNKIGIVDTFEVQFRVNERGEDSGWVKSRETIGSTGTTIIVKSLTYIALLYTVLKIAKRDENSMFHVLLDEIGTLAQGNMRKIVEFANERNILFLNAAPDSKIPDKFKNIYYFKPIGKKSKIIQVAQRHEVKS